MVIYILSTLQCHNGGFLTELAAKIVSAKTPGDVICKLTDERLESGEFFIDLGGVERVSTGSHSA